MIGRLAGDSWQVTIRRYHEPPSTDEAGKPSEREYVDELLAPNPLVIEVAGGRETTADGVTVTGADIRIVCAGKVTVAPGDVVITRGKRHRVLRLEHLWLTGVVVATSIWARSEV
jgi:hypothetical protein